MFVPFRDQQGFKGLRNRGKCFIHKLYCIRLAYSAEYAGIIAYTYN
jgi:hypothetical protein